MKLVDIKTTYINKELKNSFCEVVNQSSVLDAVTLQFTNCEVLLHKDMELEDVIDILITATPQETES